MTGAERRALFTTMLRVRRFEERCVELYSAGTIHGFLHLCIGEEAVAAGVLAALGPEDGVVSTYREHGHALARGIPMESLFAEMFGRTTGCSGGRGGSMHLFDASRRFYGGNAIVAGGIPVAVGLALADRLRGRDRVTACLFGDGAFAEGEFHESINLAALWRLPLVFLCENNRYAMGTALARSHAETDLALRAGSYGVRSWAADGMDAVAVQEATELAADTARAGAGPCFLELRTYRFRAHSMYDADRYRDRTELEAWRARDPVELAAAALAADGLLDDAGRKELEEAVGREIDDAVRAAGAAPLEPVEDLTRFVTTATEDGS
ncbi:MULTISPECIES: pyruvate dehydrogenase (acetyl-transferring) E1 component subunit alpha [unclassified Pseudonocardia]|uniref:pyruvate dehydrogenase (acetyl-transferring) E1 component subunit alpha n=1 Tax=unclassified Pseudonocardia TaxID=2619320 RepID=UPI000B2A2C8C|nr:MULTISPECIES: pyruvate dehydrogenase (acetyl-transferring) E1 component subunit alpha [unclassified Pseudonocardia]